MSLRQQKLNRLFKTLIADFLRGKAPRGTLITVTDVSVSADLWSATALLSVYPDSENASVLAFITSTRGDIHKYLADHTKMKRVPNIRFEIDRGEKNRQRIEELLGG